MGSQKRLAYLLRTTKGGHNRISVDFSTPQSHHGYEPTMEHKVVEFWVSQWSELHVFKEEVVDMVGVSLGIPRGERLEPLKVWRKVGREIFAVDK